MYSRVVLVDKLLAVVHSCLLLVPVKAQALKAVVALPLVSVDGGASGHAPQDDLLQGLGIPQPVRADFQEALTRLAAFPAQHPTLAVPKGVAPAVFYAAEQALVNLDLEALAPNLVVELPVHHVLADTEPEDLPPVGDGLVTQLLGVVAREPWLVSPLQVSFLLCVSVLEPVAEAVHQDDELASG